MEVSSRLTTVPASATRPQAILPQASTPVPETPARELDRQAANLLFSRLPSMQSLLKFCTVNGSEVTFLFRLGFFDLVEINACVKEFQQRTKARLRLLVEIPGKTPRAEDDKKSPPLQVLLNHTTVKGLSRREAARGKVLRQVLSTQARTEIRLFHQAPQSSQHRPESPENPVLPVLQPRTEPPGRAQPQRPQTATRSDATSIRVKRKTLRRPRFRDRARNLPQNHQMQTQHSRAIQEGPCCCSRCGRKLSSPGQACPQCWASRRKSRLPELLSSVVSSSVVSSPNGLHSNACYPDYAAL